MEGMMCLRWLSCTGLNADYVSSLVPPVADATRTPPPLPTAMTSVHNGAGFDFSNEIRNSFLSGKGVNLPKATSTGTTIVGLVYKDGIVLGADTRATAGPIVADKNCEKIHYITDNIRCCGAGTAADTEFITALISSNMELHALSTGRKPRV
ncbi:hypothetical protein EVG20_g8536, partial [Dentipellis fragilis]